jgi:2-polyprenyl-3-methyl-5-hydroxy-6-metoxy-1,4-benzoquinol methylase
MKILVMIVNWGTANDQYLARLIQEYQSMSFDVHVVVMSNVQKPVDPGTELFLIDLKGKDPRSMPFSHKRIFADRLNEYDLFIYSEDDTLINESNIRAFLSACDVLQENEIPGFFRYERGSDGDVNYPEVHGPFHWDCQSVRSRGGHLFAAFTNEHAACYAITRRQLERAIASGGFLVEPHRETYDAICTAGTDPYTQCKFEKVIGISPLDDFLVHHLSNRYVRSTLGVSDLELRSQVEALLQIGRNGWRPTPLFSTKSKLLTWRFSKDCYELPQLEVVKAIPDGVRNVLSIGCGSGTTEVALKEKGFRVTAVPADPVITTSAKAKGVEIVDGDLITARKKLDGEQFDCLLFIDVLHLMQDPSAAVCTFVPLLRAGGTVIARVPRVSRLTTAIRSIRGDQQIGEMGSYKRTGVHFTSSRMVRRWLESAGLRIESIANQMPCSSGGITGSFRWMLSPILTMKMGVKMVVTAKKPSVSRPGSL